jgi:pSer/pThr/pTyr-binding forkhead associated (FHA) protein
MFQLIVRGPDGSEKLYSLGADQGCLVGRDEASDIVLPSTRVSRRHARFFTTRGVLHVEDLGSQSGVFVGGARVNGVVEIRPGPPIEIGEFSVRIKREETVVAGDYLGMLQGTGAMQGRTLTLPSERAIIGREAPADIVIPDDSVSRKHAEIRKLPNGSFVVRDLNSSNGTLVNNARLPPEADRALRPSDKLQFGDTAWVVGSTHAGPPADLNRSRVRVVLFLVLITAITIGGIAAAFSVFKPTEVQPRDAKERPSAALCAEYVQNRDYAKAVTSCQKAYDEDPIDVDLRKQLRSAQLDARNGELLDKARGLANVNEWASLDVYFQIDWKSHVFVEARPEVGDILGRAKPRDFNACREAGRKKDKARAGETCAHFLDATCNCPSAMTTEVSGIFKKTDPEKAAAWHCPARVKPWIDCGDVTTGVNDACARMYPDKSVAAACVLYVNGDPKAALRTLTSSKGDTAAALALERSIADVEAKFNSGQGEITREKIREAENFFAPALEVDKGIVPTGFESSGAKTMREVLAQRLTALGVEQLGKSYDKSYRYCVSAYKYRASYPGVRDCLDKSEEALLGTIGQATHCEDMTTLLAVARPGSELRRTVEEWVQKNNCSAP